MSDALFRMVCVPAALDGWSLDMLRDGEVALLVDGGGLDAVNAVAHRLDAPTVRVVRSEDSYKAILRSTLEQTASRWESAQAPSAPRGWWRVLGCRR